MQSDNSANEVREQVKESFRWRSIHSRQGLRYRALSAFDSMQGWLAAAMIGILTACVAFLVDVAEATVSDWKLGYCSSNILRDRESCCAERHPLLSGSLRSGANVFSKQPVDLVGEGNCEDWVWWWSGDSQKGFAFGVFILLAVVFAVISSSLTMLTKHSLPTPTIIPKNDHQTDAEHIEQAKKQKNANGSVGGGKTMYMASGSGIPEIKTILSGFVIKGFLGFKVLAVKAVGAIFAVSAGMCLGKEGPFVHISACVGHLVGKLFPKYRENGRKMRDLLSIAVSSGLSVAFGAPIGGVLFSYEVRVSSYLSFNIPSLLILATGNKHILSPPCAL
jgi:chloride channel 3/4/5